MRFGIVVFPGTWSDTDCYHAISDTLKQPVQYIWHEESDLSDYDCVILPGGFSYGDYLRPGAIARFSPIVNSLKKFADDGNLVWGICNGFQILCESGLLPGALINNDVLQFRCKETFLKVESQKNPFTKNITNKEILQIPISHGQGNYFADESVINELETQDRIIFRYCSPEGVVDENSNPNGSINNIAGIINQHGNVLGMMPHPERCCDPILGNTDGKLLFESVMQFSKIAYS